MGTPDFICNQAGLFAPAGAGTGIRGGIWGPAPFPGGGGGGVHRAPLLFPADASPGVRL